MVKTTAKNKVVVGVDVGGTRTRAALCSPNGEVLFRSYVPTPASEGQGRGIEGIVHAIESVLSSRQGSPPQKVLGIGIAAAGIINPVTGVVATSPNLPLWKDVPLKDAIQDKFRLPVSVNNDANAAAFGEHVFGGGKGIADLVYVTVSTGIGGGIILDNKLYSGASGAAGEVGHMTIEAGGPLCPCGNRGCWEMLASGKALAREAARAAGEGKATAILSLAKGKAGDITAETVATAARHGDEMAKGLVSRLAFYLGVGFANLVNIFNPTLILVGGGVSKMSDLWLGQAIATMKERAFKVPAEAVRIELAKLGDDAGVLGAAALVSMSGGTPGPQHK